MLAVIVKIDGRTQSFSNVTLAAFTQETLSIRLELKHNVVTIEEIKHYAIFADNGTEIFSAQNLDKGFDDD